MISQIGRLATGAAIAAMLAAGMIVLPSCSGKSEPAAPSGAQPAASKSTAAGAASPTPARAASPTAAAPAPLPTATRAAAPAPAPAGSPAAKARSKVGVQPKATPTSTAGEIAPTDYVTLAKVYGDYVAPDATLLSPRVEGNGVAPAFRITFTNLTTWTVNHLVLHGKIKAGTVYSDEVTLTPLVDASGAKKTIAPNEGKLTVEVKFNRKALTQEQISSLPKAEIEYEFKVVELGFAD
jgi:hypothetical protein